MAQELDTTGHKCPVPVLRARRVLDGMAAGDVLIVRADDPATVEDIPAFCRLSGHHLMMVEEVGAEILFQIQARPVAESAANAVQPEN